MRPTTSRATSSAPSRSSPDIKVDVAWVSADFPSSGFSDQAGGNAFGEQFIDQNPGIDVLFQVAGLTGNGVIDAACDAGINAIGVDVDQYQSLRRPPQACILTSAPRRSSRSRVRRRSSGIADKTGKGGPSSSTLTHRRTSASPPFHEFDEPAPRRTSRPRSTRPSPGMKDGSVVSLPAGTRLRQDARAEADRPRSVASASSGSAAGAGPLAIISGWLHAHDRGTDDSRSPRDGPAHRPRSRCAGITKRYPGVVANDPIDLTSAPARSTPCSARTAPARRPS